jgi:hypothetical protein
VLDLKRRTLITLLSGAAVAWPLAARSQQGERIRRIGVLMLYPESDPQGQLRARAFRQGLEKLGWIVGRLRALIHRIAVNDEPLSGDSLPHSRPAST